MDAAELVALEDEIEVEEAGTEVCIEDEVSEELVDGVCEDPVDVVSVEVLAVLVATSKTCDAVCVCAEAPYKEVVD